MGMRPQIGPEGRGRPLIVALHALWMEGKLVRDKGADGVFRFRVA